MVDLRERLRTIRAALEITLELLQDLETSLCEEHMDTTQSNIEMPHECEAVNQLINQNRAAEAYNGCSCHGDCICRPEYDEDCEADREGHICSCTHEDQCDNCKCKEGKGLTEGEKFLKRIQNTKATFIE